MRIKKFLSRELGCEGLLAVLLILSLITGLDSSKEQRLRWIVDMVVLLAYHLVTGGARAVEREMPTLVVRLRVTLCLNSWTPELSCPRGQEIGNEDPYPCVTFRD